MQIQQRPFLISLVALGKSGDREASLKLQLEAEAETVLTSLWRVHAAPKLHRIQFISAAGFKIEEQLHAIRRVRAEYQVHDECTAAGLATEHLDLTAELVFGPSFEQFGVNAPLILKYRKNLFEVRATGPGKGSLPCHLVEYPALTEAIMVGPWHSDTGAARLCSARWV
jgi:hypothetical protein